jgi:GNAT superfamily N-acetyltransferase
VELRAATPADAPGLAETVALAMEGYRAFAPRGWDPPGTAIELPEIRERLGEPSTWCLAAWDDRVPAGHVAFIPAGMSRRPEDARPELAHLWQLFVREPWWGSGLATTLHARALEAASARGYAEMRLYTPALQARARRFYEREGWMQAGPPELVLALGLELVEYRRALP